MHQKCAPYPQGDRGVKWYNTQNLSNKRNAIEFAKQGNTSNIGH
jgi:hypothetical protein